MSKAGEVQLHHIGEALLSSIIKQITPQKFIDFLESDHVNAIAMPSNKDATINQIKNYLKDAKYIKTEIELELDIKNGSEKVESDPEGRVDVCIFTDHDYCIPIEVKMGKNGQASSWTAFKNKNLTQDSSVSYQANDKILKGKVPSFISKNYSSSDKRKNEIEGYVYRIRYQDKIFNYKEWLLCVRNNALPKFIGKENESKPYKIPLVFSIEGLIEFVAKNPDYEGIIQTILDDSRDNLIEELKG